MQNDELIQGDALMVLKTLPSESVHCCVTSPPYWGLRDYGIPGQLGLEATPEEYVSKMVEIFQEVRRVLRGDGTLWLNLGDGYCGGGGGEKRDGGHGFVDGGKPKLKAAKGALLQKQSSTELNLKPKDLCGVPWRVAFALQADGWWLRSDIIWAKNNPMPESVTDRPTKAHEYVFLLTKSARYFWDQEAVREALSENQNGGRQRAELRGESAPRLKDYHNGMKQRMSAGNHYLSRNLRSVWTIATEPFSEAHFATFPQKLVEPCIKAGTSEKGCCPECGKPWVRVVEKSGGVIGKPFGTNPNTGRSNTSNWEYRKAMDTLKISTTGWQPQCAHNLDPIPCTVIDPFSGAGTTGLVAKKLGRRSIGIELNPTYIEMAEERKHKECGKLF